MRVGGGGRGLDLGFADGGRGERAAGGGVAAIIASWAADAARAASLVSRRVAPASSCVPSWVVSWASLESMAPRLPASFSSIAAAARVWAVVIDSAAAACARLMAAVVAVLSSAKCWVEAEPSWASDSRAVAKFWCVELASWPS